MKLLTKENTSLHALLIEACADCRQQYVVPRAYSEFLFELTRNGPVCGMLQIGGNDEVITLLIERVCRGDIDVTQSAQHTESSRVQATAPLAAEFVCSLTKLGICYDIARDLLADVLRKMKAPFHGSSSDNRGVDMISDASGNPLSFFPNLPAIRKAERYASVKKNDKTYSTVKLMNRRTVD